MFGSRVGFSGTANRMAPFLVASNPRWRFAAILKHFKRRYLWNAIIRFTLCMHTKHNLPSGFIVIVNAYDRRWETYFAREGIKRRNENADLETITCEEYALDWSKSKVFLVFYSHHPLLADRSATQYDRLLASSCCPSVCPSVRPSVCL